MWVSGGFRVGPAGHRVCGCGLGWITNTILAVMLLRVAGDAKDVESQSYKNRENQKSAD